MVCDGRGRSGVFERVSDQDGRPADLGTAAILEDGSGRGAGGWIRGDDRGHQRAETDGGADKAEQVTATKWMRKRKEEEVHRNVP